MTVISSSVSSSRFKPTPPERGSFPFDRQGKCQEMAKKYLECMKSNDQSVEKCRALSREYLECRMNNNLMAKDEWRNLGFQPEEVPSAPEETKHQQNEKSK